MALPEEAATAEELLRNNLNLLQVLRIPDIRFHCVPGMISSMFHSLWLDENQLGQRRVESHSHLC